MLAPLACGAASAAERAQQPSSYAERPRAARDNAQLCAAYGAGFVKLAGSDVCVRVGGRAQAEVGARR